MKFCEELRRAADKDRLRLHTPGHKGGLCALDLTELSDGSFPGEALASAQERAAKIYGAKHLRYLCGGSSQGVKSAIYYANVHAVVDINSHRSVFDGFRLCGKNYVAVGEKGGVRPLTVKQIDGALTKQTRAVVVTTPTYFGYVADVDGIADYCKRKGLLFIADGAHGAHFGFSDLLPKSVAPIADICNMSTHKTLSALTQTAVLADNLSHENSEALGGIVDIMGTTSPSYLLYASIDGALEKAADKTTADAYAALYDCITSIKKEFPFENNDDFTRLVLDCGALGADANRLNDALARRGVYSELVAANRIVFIFTAENTLGDIELLCRTLRDSVSEIK